MSAISHIDAQTNHALAKNNAADFNVGDNLRGVNSTLVSPAKKIFVKTYGCQMNEYDSKKILDIMAHRNYQETDNYKDADLIVLNTCHIREKAAEKVYSELGRIKKHTAQAAPVIVVSGCVAQAEGEEIFRRTPYVDIVVGPQSYHELAAMVDKAHDAKLQEKRSHQLHLEFIEEKKFDFLEEELEYLSQQQTIDKQKLDTYSNQALDQISSRKDNNSEDKSGEANQAPENVKKDIGPALAATLNKTNHTSYLVSVQEGCDKFCAFCVVPYTRGAEFSRPLEQIMREVLHGASCGAKEIVLLGQNVNGYHGKFENKEINLAKLIRHVASVPQIQRIRFTTSHPMDMDDELIEMFGSEPKLMPFFNLPVQSGSNTILKLMNRKYTREKYLDIIAKLKIARPDIAMSSDFIVGFPGETDEDFQQTLDLVKEVGFAQSYSFKYSMRPGTPAVDRPQVPENIKAERLMQLQSVIAQEQLKFNQKFLGQTMPVLFDKIGKKGDQIAGRTPYMQSIYLDRALDLRNQIVDVKITAIYNNSLAGALV